MLKIGILNPHLNSLLSRVRHTNAFVIADRGFPFWPGMEIVDLSLVDGIPTVWQVLAAIRTNFVIGQAFMAEEFFLEQCGGNLRTCERPRGHPDYARTPRRVKKKSA